MFSNKYVKVCIILLIILLLIFNIVLCCNREYRVTIDRATVTLGLDLLELKYGIEFLLSDRDKDMTTYIQYNKSMEVCTSLSVFADYSGLSEDSDLIMDTMWDFFTLIFNPYNEEVFSEENLAKIQKTYDAINHLYEQINKEKGLIYVKSSIEKRNHEAMVTFMNEIEEILKM